MSRRERPFALLTPAPVEGAAVGVAPVQFTPGVPGVSLAPSAPSIAAPSAPGLAVALLKHAPGFTSSRPVQRIGSRTSLRLSRQGGVAPVVPVATSLPVLYVLSEVVSSSTASWENVARVPLAAGKAHFLTMVAGITPANTTNTKLRLQGVTGLTGVWGLMHGRESGISGDTSNVHAAALTDEISFDVNEALERGLLVYVKVETGESEVQLEVELQTASNGSARTIHGGGVIVAEEIDPDDVIAAVADSNTSTTVPKTAITAVVPAGETRLLFAFLPFTGAATSTGIKWVFDCDGGTFIADVFDVRSTLFADFASRRDDTEVNHGSGPSGTRCSLVWAVVAAGESDATFTIDYLTEVNSSAITMLDTGFAIAREATLVLDDDKVATSAGGAIDVFTQAVGAGEAWLLTMAGDHTTNHTNNEMKMGIDGIPSGGGAQWVGVWAGGGLELMSTRTTSMPSKEVGAGQGPTAGPVVNVAAVWADESPSTFALRMSAESTATILAGTAMVAQQCTIGTMPAE